MTRGFRSMKSCVARCSSSAMAWFLLLLFIPIAAQAKPTITSLSPTSGVVGTAVTINGSSFGSTQGSSTVTFNGKTATPTSWSATKIVAPVPAGATTGNVVVTVSGQASNGVSFTVIPPPNISSLSPTSGVVGTSVTVNGTNFGSTQGSSTVTFNGKTATPTSWSATKIVAPVPAGATTGNVVVTVNGQASNGVSFTVITPPSISSLSPTSGAIGTSVTITGSNFGSTQGTSTVTFNGKTATPTSWSTTSIVAPVPSGATTGNVVVTVSGHASNGVSFTVVPRPSITSASPTSGGIGTAVTINGSNFGSTQGSSTVSFNGTAATPTSWNATRIVVPVPSGATTGNVVVTVSGQASNGVNFTVIPAPSISSLSPTSGTVGTAVTIAGSNLGSTQGSSTVTFSGAAGTPTNWSASSIVVPVPSGAGTGNVTVTTAGGNSNGVNFTVLYPPDIISVSPNVNGGPPAEGGISSIMTISGAAFGATQGSSTVTFNGTAGTPTSWSDNTITVPVPLGASSGNIVVTTSIGASNPYSFILFPTASIGSLSQNAGPVGTVVTINGSSFGVNQFSSTVTFNGVVAAVSSWSATSIVVTVPATATTGNVVVTTPGGPSNGVLFTITTTPVINSISPTSGAVGTSVTIVGTGFNSSTGYVTFNGTVASPASWSDTNIVTPVPPGATTGNVVVENVGSQFSNGINFTVLLPTINSLSPTSGGVGTVVTITGSNFGATQGNGTVTFNGTIATPSSWSATSIVAPVPSGATSGNVVVTAGGLTSIGITFNVGPGISSLSPAAGVVGTVVTITGNNFGPSQGSSTLTFNGAAATPSSWSVTSIVTAVPSGATSGNVVVTVGGQVSNGFGFSVAAPPSISTLSSSVGAVGTSITITGSNFGATQGPSTVTFNDIPATPASWSSTSIVVPVPSGATTGNLGIEACVQGTGCLLSNEVPFTVVPQYISGISPTSGAMGTSVTISGNGFGASQGNNQVILNGLYAAVSSWSDTSIVIQVPVGNTTGNAVVLVNSQASNGVAFTGICPSITSISPNSGPQGTSVTITGAHFGATQSSPSSQSSVAFNGVQAVPSSWSDTSIVAVVPVGNTTGNVVVTTSNTTVYATQANASQTSNAVPFTGVPPNISSISPASGALGATITINGSHFGAPCSGTNNLCADSVTFNALPAPVTSWSDTSIVAQVPPGNSTGSVVVTTSNPQWNSSQSSNRVPFTGIAPSISNISPTSAPVGASITINGSHFSASSGCGSTYTCSVSFNGLYGSISSWSDTSIVAFVPAGNTTGNALVTLNNGTLLGNHSQTSNGVAFTGIPPNISSISPTLGAAGTSITISGSHFGASSGCGTNNTCSVMFNGIGASISSWSDTSIVVQVPSGNTTGNVVVVLSNGGNLPNDSEYSNGVPFTGQTPTISGLSPTSGLVGASITITGSYFGTSSGTVTFSGYAAGIVSWSNTSIVASVPTPATTGNVVVTAGQASNGVVFTVLPPAITTISPTAAGVGIPVTITGNNFGLTQGATTLAFNGIPAPITSWSETSIVTAVPAGATTGNVAITENSQASNSVNFTVLAPTIATLSPGSGSTGTLVTIAGSNFAPAQGGSTVTFNGTPVTPTSWSLNGITVSVPSGVTTGNVVVTVGAQSSNAVLFTVGSATLTAVSPASGGPGTAVTISGTNLGATQGSSTVAFNGIAATPINWSADSITTLAPATATTGNVVVTVSGQASNGVNFTVTSNPAISSISPRLGTVGTSVTITGNSFGATQGSSTITFNSTPAIPTSWNATSIAVPVPSGATTGDVVVTVSGQASNGMNFDVAGNAINYAYDDVGRLTGVVDPSGNVATYSYDAVGNILSIGRPTPGQVTILAFSPSSGSTGSSVTITGAGFSPVLGQNTVQFDGVSATITSATPAQLVAVVPSGAGTGPITVTSPGGIATSSRNFTVMTGVNAPAISGFNPNIAVSGAALTISGSNFDPNSANDLTTINITRQFQQSVINTSTISTTVPNNTGSGHITISTPTGQAVSSQDLYVPFCCYAATDVGATGRITSGGSQTVSFPLPNGASIGMLLFDATAGQQATVNVTPNPGSTACQIALYDPRNRQLASTTYCYQSLNGINLPLTGTYTIGVFQFATSGSALVGLNLTPPPVTGTIQPGGPPVTVNIPTAGQSAQLAFHGALAQKISISVSSAAYTSYGLQVNDPQGIFVMGSGSFPGGQSTYIDTTTLAASGKYTIVISPGTSGTTTGSITLQVNHDADATGTITAGGAPATAATTVPGQDARLTFIGTSGQKVSVGITNVTNQANVSLLNSDGSQNGLAVAVNPTGGPFLLDPVTLPSNGAYSLWVQHQGPVPGHETLQIYNVSDLVAPITPGGSALTVATTTLGQDVRLQFSGTAGQKVSLLVTSVTNPSAMAVLLNPDGTTLRSIAINNSGSSFFLDASTLPANGTYTVWIQHNGGNIGSETVQLYNASDITGAITAGGAAVTETTVPGQDVRLSFSGISGQKISMAVSNVTNPDSNVYILNPDGTTFGQIFTGTGGPFYLNVQSLAQSGTYTIWVQHIGSNAGSETIQPYDASDVTGTITAGGSAVTETSVLGQDVRLTFSGTAGQQISVTASNVTNHSALMNLLDPSGRTLAATYISDSDAAFIAGPITLAATGTYTVWVQHQSTYSGSETLQLYNVTVTGAISINGSPVTVSLPAAGQSASLTLSGQFQSVTVHVTNNSIGPVTVSEFSYINQLLTQTTSSSANFDLQSVYLPGSATQIAINPVWNGGASPGSITVTVTNP